MQEHNNIRKKNSAFRLFGVLFSYRWIVQNLTFFLFLASLAVVYIANGHMSANRIRKINDAGRRLKDLQYEYKTLKSEMMFKSRKSEMVKASVPLGLTIDSITPITIKLISRKVKLEN